MANWPALLSLIILPNCSMTGTTDSCRIGQRQQASLERSTLVGLFLNFEHPAQCRGTVSKWRYCYYRAEGSYNDNDKFKAKIMVYRQNRSHNNQYERVSRSIIDLSIKWEKIEHSYNCKMKNKQFEILENDIIGACIIDHDNNHPLHLVGATEGSNLSTYQLSQDGSEECTASQVQNIDTNRSIFIKQHTIFLHVYADIIIGELHSNILNVSILLFSFLYYYNNR